METVLAKIVADKALWVEARKAQQPLASFQNDVVPSTRRFYDALQGTRTVFILECKKASPSKGVIRSDFDPARIAGVYTHHASAISVLTTRNISRAVLISCPSSARLPTSRCCAKTLLSTRIRFTWRAFIRPMPAC